MHYFLFPEKDTTLFEASSSLNAGLDEVLEIRKNVSETGATVDVSRILMKFDLTYISESIVNNRITNPKYFLNLYDANPKALATSQSLYAYPVSGSWDMGTGRSYDNPQTADGASWKYRYGDSNGTTWSSTVSSSGGVWWSGSGFEASHSYDHNTKDMRMNVTLLVNQWLSGSIVNDGFMIKRSGSIGNADPSASEGSTARLGSFAFFSSNTNTIYPPTLEVVWDDSKWSTGSLSPLTGSALEDMTVYMKGLRPEYKEKSKARFRLVGRERFPAKTYSTTPSNLNVKYLPSTSSFYSIVDAETEDVIVPYGTGSKLSCDSTGNYFNLWLDGYQPERYYSIQYRIVSGSGTVEELDQYFDEGFTFKVSL
tara:strand:+ start:232 stop:1335 length:1104 start_codon:yes stop_codon:yes gene_type:complete